MKNHDRSSSNNRIMFSRCAYNHKRIYNTKKRTIAAISTFRNKVYDGKPRYPYKCPHCKKWHITSMRPDDQYSYTKQETKE